MLSLGSDEARGNTESLFVTKTADKIHSYIYIYIYIYMDKENFLPSLVQKLNIGRLIDR